ncbi:DUF3127 domain-containing protein [Marinagarivorans algicola]|uniref:DUF3127 domain-containing protein n=1 Tax=Marinagarivorans algicola TaxID=1513270 RepID=UPI0006B65243|nr:DUF3127 domain-containing protein [Marinagarivorans algicola]
MSKTFEIQGLIHSIGETTEYGNNGFTKREFVIKLTGDDENSAYPNHIALELIKDKCALMDSYKEGDEIKAFFSLSGRLWSGGGKPEKCFTSLQAWKIEAIGSHPATVTQPAAQAPQETFTPATAPIAAAKTNTFNNAFDDDIPF